MKVLLLLCDKFYEISYGATLEAVTLVAPDFSQISSISEHLCQKSVTGGQPSLKSVTQNQYTRSTTGLEPPAAKGGKNSLMELMTSAWS